MQNNNIIFEELKLISPKMATLNNINIYDVPKNYFNDLPNKIVLKIKNEGFNILSLNKTLINTNIPIGYFSNLADNILNKINATSEVQNEFEAISPFLNSISNQNIFTVPKGYFETLSIKTPEKINTTFKLIKNTNGVVKVMKYAVAAMFATFLALGIYKYTVNTNQHATLPTYIAEGQKISNVDEELAKIDDEEIVSYLQSNGESIDVQTIAASIVNDDDLPTKEDYLFNENTLNKYLENVDVTNLKNN